MKNIFNLEGMTCVGCETRLEKKLGALTGVLSVKANYSKNNVEIHFNEKEIKKESIIKAIEKLDYKVINVSNKKGSVNQVIGIVILVLAFYLIINSTVGFNFIPQINQNMGFGILFVVGLITSLHCIAMCGGINLSQCVAYKFEENEQNKLKKLKPSLLYNLGRVVSYTIIGGVVGAIGSVLSFTGAAKGIVAILSGVFMVVMGLNMLNIFPWLRKFNPRLPKFLGKIAASNKGGSPFYVGLLNGLMPCGPLQAMQLYALGTGSFFVGAFSMFMFSLGTVPLMFGFGALSSFLSSKFTQKMMKVSAVLVMLLGVIMLTRGLSLSGVNTALATSNSASNAAKVEGNVQVITSKFTSGSYAPITVQKGVPVKWIVSITQDDLNGCNNTVIIPKYNITKKLVAGDNEINFTPNQEGTITYTCWMGMIRSTIRVVPDASNVTASSSEIPAQGNTNGGCCAVTN